MLSTRRKLCSLSTLKNNTQSKHMPQPFICPVDVFFSAFNHGGEIQMVLCFDIHTSYTCLNVYTYLRVTFLWLAGDVVLCLQVFEWFWQRLKGKDNSSSMRLTQEINFYDRDVGFSFQLDCIASYESSGIRLLGAKNER